MDLIADLALVLLAATTGGFLAQRLRQPLIVGYIVAGIAIGPFTGGPTVGNVQEIEQLAELGVVLLLFSLGLELSFRELTPVRAVALGGTAIQVALTMAIWLTLWVLYGRSWPEVRWGALLLGIAACVVALSSFYGRQCPAPSVSVLFVAQALSLLVWTPLLRIRLFPPNELSETGGRKWQFSIRTLLLVTSLVALVTMST